MFSGPTPDLLNQQPWMESSRLCVFKSPPWDSDPCTSLRTPAQGGLFFYNALYPKHLPFPRTQRSLGTANSRLVNERIRSRSQPGLPLLRGSEQTEGLLG